LNPGDSASGDAVSDKLLTGRLLSFRELLKGLRDDVEATKFPEHSVPARKLVSQLIGVLIDEVKITTDELAHVSRPADKARRARSLHDSLDQFTHFVRTVLLASQNLPNPFFQLIEMIEDGLPSEWRFGFLVWNRTEFGTMTVNNYLAQILQPYPAACDFLEHEDRSWVFLVPPSIIEEPLNWPLMSHEVAHILEQARLHAVSSVYGPRPRSSDPYDKDVLRYRHAEEYQADFVAGYLLGPSFVLRILTSYFTREIRISPTHPSWEQRVKALMEVGLGRMPSSPNYSELVRTPLTGIPLEGGVVDYKTVDLAAVIDTTLESIKGKISPFDCASAQLQDARNRLRRFLPYTEDYRAALNAAILDEQEALSYYILQKLGPPDRVDREFRYLVLDCIRLPYLRMHYDRRVRLAAAAKEAEETLAKSGPEPAA